MPNGLGRIAVGMEPLSLSKASQPNGLRQQLEDYLGSELASGAPFKVMNATVLRGAKNDQVRGAIVKSIPVNVVDILSRNGFSADQLVSQPNVVGKALSVNDRSAVARGIAGASEFVGTHLRAALNRALSSQSTGSDGKLISAIRAFNLDPDVVRGLLAPSSVYGAGWDMPLTRLSGAETGTKPTVSMSNDTGKGGEPSSAELTRLLNRHSEIVNSRPDNAITKQELITGGISSMKIPKMTPEEAEKYRQGMEM